ncbi:MAG: hypothetical protein J6P21_01240 [Clostridia bacterium]|nr:hypothetical protein [Clostridia bacterium]
MFSKKIVAAMLLLGLAQNQCSAMNVGKDFKFQIVKNASFTIAGALGGVLGTLLVQKIGGKNEKQEQNPGELSVKVTDEVICRCILDYENQKAQWEIFDENLRKKIEEQKPLIEYEFKTHRDAIEQNLGFVNVKFKNSDPIYEYKKINFDYKNFIKSLRNCVKSDNVGCCSIERLILAKKGVFEMRKTTDGSYYCWYAVKNLDGQFARRNVHDMVGDSKAFLSVLRSPDKNVYIPDDDYGLKSKKLNFKITEEYFDKLVGNEKK